MTDDIKGKIRKLLNMTTANGATEDEAETAMRMAMGLMAKHGIEQSSLGGEASKAKMGSRVPQQFRPHQLILAQAAGVLYGCKTLFYSMGKHGLVFVGRPDNIDAAEQTMFWLMRQTEEFYKLALPRGLSKPARSDFRRSFKDACANRVLNRAYKLVDDMQRNNQQAQAATGSTALVVQGYFDNLRKENELATAEFNVKTKSVRMKYGSGTPAGVEAGDRVQLRREVQ